MPPRLDPTLETNLINQVKTEQNSDALTTLVAQYSGVYFSVVNRYAQAYPDVIKSHDLANDQYYNLYRFVSDYDAERRTKLSTYIHDRTDYLCKSMLKMDRRDPLAGAVCLNSGRSMVDPENDPGSAVSMSTTLIDENEDVVESADKDLKIEDILKTAQRLCTDARFITILQYRHFQSPAGVALSWRQIGKLIGLSHERVRKVYLENMEIVRREMNKEPVSVV